VPGVLEQGGLNFLTLDWFGTRREASKQFREMMESFITTYAESLELSQSETGSWRNCLRALAFAAQASSRIHSVTDGTACCLDSAPKAMRALLGRLIERNSDHFSGLHTSLCNPAAAKPIAIALQSCAKLHTLQIAPSGSSVAYGWSQEISSLLQTQGHQLFS